MTFSLLFLNSQQFFLPSPSERIKNGEPERKPDTTGSQRLLPPSSKPAITLKEDRQGSRHMHGATSLFTQCDHYSWALCSTGTSLSPSRKQPVTKSVSREFSREKTCSPRFGQTAERQQEALRLVLDKCPAT